MQYIITKGPKNLTGNIDLSTSKSITNRLLIIRALTKKDFNIQNPSSSNDSMVLMNALNNPKGIIDIGPAGTAMRFLTAYLALAGEQDIILTGSERMKQRPIKILVDALQSLGADISYEEESGYPPLRIKKGNLLGGELTIDGSISSQYITALLLIGPNLPKGLKLSINNKLVSEAYVELTLSLMQYMGIQITQTKNEINIPHQPYKAKDITVEADWSSASYWYEMAAFAEDVDLTIQGLAQDSLQGDSIVATLFQNLGVCTQFTENGIHLSKQKIKNIPLTFDFTRCPDLVQTLAVTCALKGIPFEFKGTETLRIKETDRIAALQNELRKMGYLLETPNHGMLTWNGKRTLPATLPVFKTYEDHRMAMAFAPIAIQHPGIKIHEPRVVSKSYPEFWDHLKNTGFVFEETD